jgi:glycosyltransferase involved in cell wall biosynthesis
MMVVGRVASALQVRIDRRAQVPVHWVGQVSPERIPEFDRSAHMLYSADLNSACPNSVIEALACGLPVVAFDTGALPELVTSEAGRLAPYGGDPWRLDRPDFTGLTEAALSVLENQARFRSGARKRAENGLDLETMVDGYLSALGWA